MRPILLCLAMTLLPGDDKLAACRHAQQAIDEAFRKGGGVVEIPAGRHLLADTLRLRDNVKVVGVPGKTILVIGPGRKTRLTKDIAKGSTEITVADASGFEVGDGIALEDKAGHGFEVTTATLVERLGPKSFRISSPAVGDYLVSRHAELKRTYSGVGGWGVKNATLEGVTVEGNFGQPGSEYLGGCRGGGIYLSKCDKVVIRKCVVRKFNGDAISFQEKCRDLTIEQCLCELNANVGMHPGSGSEGGAVRDNILRKNGYVGLFVCVDVRKIAFERNEIIDNGGCGVSIGFGDSDNLFRFNRILNNAETGILFRRDSPKVKDGAHRNVFEKNLVKDNLGPRPPKSNSRPESAGKASVVIEGAHEGLVFRDNDFTFTQPHAGPAILHDATSTFQATGNKLANVPKLTEASGK